MKFQRTRIHNINKTVLETIYEDFESEIVRFCIAEKNDMKTTCIFYGENNLCEFLLELPIELGYRHELPINKVNDKVFPFDDCKIVCYVLKDGKKLWERKVKNINNVFECRDRLYCVQNEVGIIILSAMTGEQISKIACFRKGWSMPNVIRINERHLMKCTPFGRQF